MRWTPYGETRQRQQRIPSRLWRRIPDDRRQVALDAHVARCDELCRMLEVAPSDLVISEAQDRGAITEEQAADLRDQGQASTYAPPAKDRPLTIVEAFEAHHSTRREDMRAGADYRHHRRALDEFIAWSSCRVVSEITVDLVIAYIDTMRARGRAWDTRRHALIPIRRAAKYGVTRGIPDPLAGTRLDKNDRPRRDDRGVSLPEIAAALHASDVRGAAVIALGAGMGLRSAEIRRAEVGDIDGEVLRVGVRERKNRDSRRDLPVPPSLMPYLIDADGGRASDEALIPTHMHGRTGQAMEATSWAHWVQQMTTKAFGRRVQAGALRQSFASWCILHQVPADVYERYLGHRMPSVVCSITRDHYTLQQLCEDLRLHGVGHLEEILRPAINGQGKRPGKYVLRVVK
jgi:integrase